MVAPNQLITIVSTAPARRVTGLRGQTAPIVASGAGGWQTVPRPHRKSLTEWTGIDPIGITLSLLFDESVTGLVEDDCLTLEQMAQPTGTSPPPEVTVIGAVPHADLAWVIANLAWDPAPVYATAGHRLRHEATVTLLERVTPDTVKTAAATARAKTATGTHPPYVVKAGDTLVKIAASQLGDFTRWSAIATLNGLRDPNRLTAGQRLRLP